MAIIGLSLVLLVLLPLAAFYVWTLIDALRTPAAVWERAGQNQLLWVGVIVFVSLLGAILYVFVARPQLLAAIAAESDEATSMVR